MSGKFIREVTRRDAKEMQEELLLKDEVYAVIGAAVEVHKTLGPGFSEAIYQEAMGLEMTTRAIPHEPQKPLAVKYKQWVLRKQYFADFVCYGQLLVEVKAPDRLSGTEEGQVLNYLKATGLQFGLLINFGCHGKLQWKRFVMTRHGLIDPDEPLD